MGRKNRGATSVATAMKQDAGLSDVTLDELVSRLESHIEKAMKADGVFDGNYEDVFKSVQSDMYKSVLATRRGSSEEEDPFKNSYVNGLITPTPTPEYYLRTAQYSDVVRFCIGRYIANVIRPYQFDTMPGWTREDESVQRDETAMQSWFGEVNEDQDWLSFSREILTDQLACGNAYAEVLDDKNTGQPDFAYYLPARNMRVTVLDDAPFPFYTKIRRNGKLVDRVVYRRFRRFARLLNGETQIRWFKEFGDPRVLNCDTGEYMRDSKGLHVVEYGQNGQYTRYDCDKKATSVMWWADRFGGEPYGSPLWAAAQYDVVGRYEAQWVNYDMLAHNGIPPWLLIINGRLSPASRSYIKEWLKSLRDPKSWNAPGLFEIEARKLSLNQSGSGSSGAQFFNLRDMRAEDAMFKGYQDGTWRTMMGLYRLYSFFHGSAAERESEEKEVFAPLRQERDSDTTSRVIQRGFQIYTLKMRTKRSSIGDEENLFRALGMAGRTGGPSINELKTQLNEVFGTDWPINDHPFYSKLTSAEAVAMVRQGMMTYDPETWEPIPLDPTKAGSGSPVDTGILPAAKSDTSTVEEKLQALGVSSEMISIAVTLQQIASKRMAAYQPPDTDGDDDDFVQ